MDTKQKAEAYDKLLIKAKQIYNKENDVLIIHTIEDLFPEFKEEFEDERIRKKLIAFLKTYDTLETSRYISWLKKQNSNVDNANKEYWRGYREGKQEILDKYAELEKQVEQKPYGQRKECSDCQFNYAGECKGSCQMKRNEIDKDKAEIDHCFTKMMNCEKVSSNEEKYNGEDYGIDGLWHAMNILEKTLGKVSGYQTDDGFLSHQCAITAVKKLYKKKPVEWSEEDERIYQSIIDDTVQENQLDSKQIDWLKSIKSRVQPKQEWSEEDKVRIEQICDDLECGLENFRSRKNVKGLHFEEIIKSNIDWLKSLKDRYIWKPSKEQLKSLKEVIDVGHFTSYPNALETLYEQLKKLREE